MFGWLMISPANFNFQFPEETDDLENECPDILLSKANSIKQFSQLGVLYLRTTSWSSVFKIAGVSTTWLVMFCLFECH